ncbi:hypothetical protein [Desulfoscipio gibsoniae]|uniref:Uncharacterized protein n=1 Tax=Desulfoscipio gibsoniae DSM 7213 TaxID=767817 RepID=R4KB65_9FIRM|nr:hypothetical protein [Desulfoscipio gibsoniae]AGL00418.1 hypothetical protein Desgi_0869 [Desulfoscipio gibsoniae DSM 7213]
MKAKKLFAIFVIIIIGIFLATSYSPELAIRRHLLFINPYHSLTCSIKKTEYIDKRYGQQYTIDGLVDPSTKMGIHFAYVKKNFLGWYYWSGGGTGP